jgi:hypothetical protein
MCTVQPGILATARGRGGRSRKFFGRFQLTLMCKSQKKRNVLGGAREQKLSSKRNVFENAREKKCAMKSPRRELS